MKKTIEYEIRYDAIAEISYTGEEEPKEHHFHIIRSWGSGIFGDEEEYAIAYVGDDGRVEIEGDCSLRDEEAAAISKMMEEILNK